MKPTVAAGEQIPREAPCSIKPIMFKSLVGTFKNEFASMKQQDAMEFLQFLLDLTHKREHARAEGQDPTQVFDMQMIERLECSLTHQVRYHAEKTNHLLLPMPMDKSQNPDEVEMYEAVELSKSEEQKKAERDAGTAPTPVRHRIRLEDCFGRFFDVESIDDWFSPAANQKTTAYKSKRIAEFPKILTLSMLRFKTDLKAMKVIKIEDFVEVPDEIDLAQWRGQWLQPGEVEMKGGAEEKSLQLDEQVIQAIMSMGFPRVRAERAAFNNQGKSADAAVDWLFGHMDDADLDTPLPQLQKAKAQEAVALSEENLQMLMSMGFSRQQSEKGLRNTQNNVERAIEWLFSHQDDMDTETGPAAAPARTSAAPTFAPTSSRYRLSAFITHMGHSVQSGHYVAHIKVNGKWYIYNDSRVAESQDPPREMAYIYFFERI
jgi:ubiquitin carboxyl-terminal hydrolase 5/13